MINFISYVGYVDRCQQLQCGCTIVIARSVIVLWKKLWNLTKSYQISVKFWFSFYLSSSIFIFFVEHVTFERGKYNFKLHQHQRIGRYDSVAIDSISCSTAFFINKIDRDSSVNNIICLFLLPLRWVVRFRSYFRSFQICILHILLLRAWYQLHNISRYRGFFSLCAQYFEHFH